MSQADTANIVIESTVLVPEYQLESFDKALSRLNKKAASFGLNPISILNREVREYGVIRNYEEQGDADIIHSSLLRLDTIKSNRALYEDFVKSGAYVERHHAITISYPMVKLGNWQVIAKKQSMGEGQNLVFCISSDPEDQKIVANHHDSCIGCDHCKTKRNRNISFILKDNETSAFKEIGSSCIEDFTGIDPAAALFLSKMHDFVRVTYGDEADYRGSPHRRAFSTDIYLCYVAYLTDRYGFVSSTKARESCDGIMATYDEAALLPGYMRDNPKLYDAFMIGYEERQERIRAMLGWYKNTPCSPSDSFGRNVRLLLDRESISFDRKHLAFAAAAYPMYLKALEFQRERAQQAPLEYIGTPGEKFKTILRVTGCHSFETDFGTNHLIMLRDKAGNPVVWKTGSPPRFVFEEECLNKEFLASFKVKEHSTYKDSIQTRITNLKWMGWTEDLDVAESAPAPAKPKKSACSLG